MFSCRECSELFAKWAEQGITQIVVVGIETHVCVLQTALDLLAESFSVFLVLDAIGSRNAIDHQTAVRRMETLGVNVCTKESVLFEWCETSLANEFKQISKLVTGH